MKLIAPFILLLLFSCQLFSQNIPARLDSLFRVHYGDHAPGIAVAVVVKGKTIFKKGYGISNWLSKEKITTTTNFNIGSLTKQFTAYCILKLEQEGHLSLTDKLIKYFPDFNPKTGNMISIEQLLTHSSGIIDHYAFTDKEIKHANDQDVLTAVKNIDSTYFTPGKRYRYSNTAYCLLALIVEKVSGTNYADYVQKNIFAPLFMNRSTVLRVDSNIYQRAIGYDIDPQGRAERPFVELDMDETKFFSTEGDGGVYTSIDDYLKWCIAMQTGTVLSKPLIKKAQSFQVMLDPAKQLGYGYGWFINQQDSAKVVYHTGSNGGFRAITYLIPSQKYAVVIFSNRTDGDLENMVKEINKILNIANKSYTKIESLVSFIDSSPIFAPCKEIRSFLTLFTKNLNDNATALN